MSSVLKKADKLNISLSLGPYELTYWPLGDVIVILSEIFELVWIKVNFKEQFLWNCWSLVLNTNQWYNDTALYMSCIGVIFYPLISKHL